MNDIVAAFHKYFEIVDVNSEELLREVFHLRYRVLCVEENIPGFEASNFLEEIEKDHYDDHSAHILLRHRPSDSFVGTARVILHNTENPRALFPTEQYTQFYPEFTNIINLSRRHTGEISRLVILAKYSKYRVDRRKSRSIVNTEKRIKEDRRIFPHLILGLATGIIKLCAEHNIIHWLSSMNPATNRLLGFYGLQLDAIGPPAEFHGIRKPYYANLSDVMSRMYLNHREIWELVTNDGRFWPKALERRQISRIPMQEITANY